MATTEPANTLTIPLGPSGVELGPDEKEKKFNLLLEFLQPRGPCAEPRATRWRILPPCQANPDNEHYFVEPFTEWPDGSDEDHAEVPTTGSSVDLSIELKPVSVPAEIFLNIIGFLEQPYILRAELAWNSCECVWFREIRPWADIRALHICRATRQQAIRHYGNPSPDTLPFDPSVDRLRLGYTPEEVSEYSELESQMPDYYKPLGIDILAKAQYVEIQQRDAARWPGRVLTWVKAHLLASTSIRTLKLSILLNDDCYVKDFGVSDYRHPWRIRMAKAVFSSPDFLKTLEVLEFEITGTYCNKLELRDSMESRYFHPRRFYRPTVGSPLRAPIFADDLD